MDAQHVEFVYESSEPHVQLRWQWRARAHFGPIEHSIQVVNLSPNELWLPLIDGLQVDWHLQPQAHIQTLYVEKGADIPSGKGTHLDAVENGYRWMGRSTTYAHPIEGQAREIIPSEIVFQSGGLTTDSATHDVGWCAGIEFSGRTRITLERDAGSLGSVLGLNPELGPYRTRLLPNDTFLTPTVFLGAFSGTVDDAGQQLRGWVRKVLGNPKTWEDS